MGSSLVFPEGFLWGAATSSHQVEGSQDNDWSAWEQLGKVRDGSVSGIACDSWNRYQEDFDIAKELGFSAHRFSIEWSRIEPRPGQWNEAAVERYRDMVRQLRQRGIEPFVTLWHFTSPRWFMERGGWSSAEAAHSFAMFASRMVRELPDVKFWLTVNEPNVYVTLSYLVGVWPPETVSSRQAYRVFQGFIRGHHAAYKKMKNVRPDIQVGSAHSMIAFEPRQNPSWLDRMATHQADHWYNRRWLSAVVGTSDFIGVNHYTRQFVHWESLRRPIVPEFGGPHQTDFGWDMYPEGIYRVLKQAGSYGLPVYITENGLADQRDQWRKTFIRNYLSYVHKAIKDGVNVRGYLHWSLLDNFEWREGFAKRFGLVEVDFTTQRRTVRPSARYYAEICRTNQLSLDDA